METWKWNFGLRGQHVALQGEKKLIGETVFGDSQVYRLEGQETGKGEEKSRRALLECFSGSFGVSQGTSGHRAGVRSTFLSEIV